MDNPILSIEIRLAALTLVVAPASAAGVVFLAVMLGLLLELLLLELAEASKLAVKLPYHSVNHPMPSSMTWLPKSV